MAKSCSQTERANAGFSAPDDFSSRGMGFTVASPGAGSSVRLPAHAFFELPGNGSAVGGVGSGLENRAENCGQTDVFLLPAEVGATALSETDASTAWLDR